MRMILVAALLVSGCGASMVNPPGERGVANAPVNEAVRPGVIKYLNQGADSVRKDRRADAYAQMSRACAGTYRIDAEGPRIEGGVVVPLDGALVTAPTDYWYIQFSCMVTTAQR